MKIASIAALGLAAMMGLASIDADAKRLGGGRSSGMQRDTPARTTPDSTPAKPAAPTQQATPASPSPAAAAAPAAKPSFMSRFGAPLAALAAGLGIAALMSHLGLGEAFGNFLMMALLAVALIFVVRWFMRRKQQPQPAGMAYSGNAPAAGQVAWPTPNTASGGGAAAAEPVAASPAVAVPEASAAPAAPAPARAFVPAAFDAEGFARTAKMIFIRLQAANDSGDRDDLRAFTTPEMFAELSLDLQERGTAQQQTEVLNIDAEVLDVTDEPGRQVVSVRFRGQVLEAPGTPPATVDEVWHLTKPADGSRSWAIAGIEQWK